MLHFLNNVVDTVIAMADTFVVVGLNQDQD